MDRVEMEQDFFGQHSAPDNLAEHQKLVCNFVGHHCETGQRVVLVTSGGTTVPLETQTVRFIDNFSRGTRGARSAEYFLEKGYGVIFLHRQGSLLPYARRFNHPTKCLLDLLETWPNPEGNNGRMIMLRKEYGDQMFEALERYHFFKRYRCLLLLPFETVSDYLFQLRSATMIMQPLRSKALIYLAAAVSDYYIPRDEMVEHKIQSSSVPLNPELNDTEANENATVKSEEEQGSPQNLTLDLKPVPKFLKTLVDKWAPEGGMVVSFKLETDRDLLLHKARNSLQRYGQHLVIGNLLSTRAREVYFVTPDPLDEQRFWVPNPAPPSSDGNGLSLRGNIEDQCEIESLIVTEVANRHQLMMV